jgi:hypothetical protein
MEFHLLKSLFRRDCLKPYGIPVEFTVITADRPSIDLCKISDRHL